MCAWDIKCLRTRMRFYVFGLADRPDTWRNITLLWLGKNSSKRVDICKSRQIPGKSAEVCGRGVVS